MGTKPES